MVVALVDNVETGTVSSVDVMLLPETVVE